MADIYDSGSGVWTAPDDGFVDIESWGGGAGGGAGEDGSNAGGSGGGSGEYRKITARPVVKDETIAYQIGAYGPKGTYPNDDASDGDDTIIDGGTMVAAGGGRGRGQGNGNIAGAGGTGGTGGDVVVAGGNGSVRSGNDGGAGGGAPNGGTGGTAGISTTVDGGNASAPGAGGGGGGKGRDGGNGAAGRAKFTFTTAPIISSEILRPIAGLEEFAGDTNWQNIDDAVSQPTTPGDMSYFTQPSGGGGSLQKIRVAAPTPGYTILSAKLWMLAHADFYIPGTTEFKVFTIRLKIAGTWYDLGVVNQLLSTTPTWYSFELTELSESSSSGDIGFEWVLTDIWGTYSGQDAKVDVAYLELTYPEISQSSGFFHWF